MKSKRSTGIDNNLDSYFNPAVLKKIRHICRQFHEDDEVNFFIGDYYWKQLSSFWRFEWINHPNHKGLVPQKRSQFTYKGINIIHDTENYYRFDIAE